MFLGYRKDEVNESLLFCWSVYARRELGRARLLSSGM